MGNSEHKPGLLTVLINALLCILGAGLLAYGVVCYQTSLPSPAQTVQQAAPAPVQTPPEEKQIVPEITELSEQAQPDTVGSVRLMAVGDNLIHNTIYWSAEQEDGSYDFTPDYADIAPVCKQYDLACINQETILVNDPALYGNYPHFGTPTAVGDALADAGFNVVSHANNHCFDKGETGIFDSVEFWRTQHPEVFCLGIHDTEQDRAYIRVATINGIRIAMLNYTYGLNGSLPSKRYMIDLLDETLVAEDIARAEELSDFIVVFVHWGTEDSHSVDEYQRTWARFFAEHNVGLVIGAHSHLVQPMEVLKTADGRDMPVYYSLGNFLSHQMSADQMLGGLASVTITKDDSGTYCSEYELLPTVNFLSHRDSGGWSYRPMLLSSYTDEMAKQHRFSQATVEYLTETFEQATKPQKED